MSDVLDGKRAVELGKEEVKRRLADGTAYLDVVVKGKWVEEKYDHICSECGKSLFECFDDYSGILELPNFCLNCGADMREDGVDATEN